MTVGLLCLDGLDIRIASDVGLFEHVPVTAGQLRNDLDGTHPLFTPRVWTSIFAGEDQDDITGWTDASEWADRVDDAGLAFLWDRVPVTLVHDLHVHRHGYTSDAASMPNDWTPVNSTMEQLQYVALQRAEYWNQDLAGNPPVLASWFQFPDGYGHYAVQQDADLADGYRWMRDTLFETLDWPDHLVIISDHGFVRDTANADLGNNRGRSAHRRSGVLATSKRLQWEDDYSTLTDFIPVWQDRLSDFLTRRQLDALGYE